jgi:hypothetical protein
VRQLAKGHSGETVDEEVALGIEHEIDDSYESDPLVG